jgi:hypothetical protein
MAKDDQHVAERFAEQVKVARARLRLHMDAMGLTERLGWRISESTRHGLEGMELIMRPLHLSLPAPPEVECVVRVDGDEGAVDAECRL